MKKSPAIQRKNGNSAEPDFVATKESPPVDWERILARVPSGKTVLEYSANRKVFTQGQAADSMFFLISGKVRLSVKSDDKEATIATLGSGEFFGEGCLASQPVRMATAITGGDCTLIKVDKPTMARMLHEEQALAETLFAHLLSRNLRYEADLVDQFFNSSEKRLARILLLLSHFGKDSTTEAVVPGINQENLAQMVGTTRSRVSYFMNKFRKLGFVDYGHENGGIRVHSGLLSVVQHDGASPDDQTAGPS